MFFCEKCRYLFNVTKDIKTKQIGGKISDALNIIFDKFNSREKIIEKDLKNIKGKDILDDEKFETMNKKDQRKLISNIKTIDKNFFNKEVPTEKIKIGSNIAYFICKFCKNYRPITAGTLIYSKNYNSIAVAETEDYTYALYDHTLPRTRNYICKNPECATHSDDALKEAILTKNVMEQIVYICTYCSTSWVNTI